MFQFFYHLVWLLALLLLSPVYAYRFIAKGKYRSSTLARLGFQSIVSGQGKNIVWLHGVSLGESQIAGQFAKVLKSNDASLYIVASSCTETGQAVLRDSEAIDFSFYYPIDVWPLVRHLFTRLKPKAIYIMETDLWPNMLNIAVNKAVPVYVINAKLSESSFINYQRLPFLKNILFDAIDYFFVQCNTYAERFERLGVQPDRMAVLGNIKLDRQYPQKTAGQLSAFAHSLGLDKTKPCIVFASTHEGEEQGFIEVYQALKKQHRDLQCILVPRHPERFRDVEKLLKQTGIAFENYSMQLRKTKTSDVLLVDAMGVLLDIYAIADVAVVAGSFTPHVGGHNVFEPAFFSKAVVYGPWIFKQPGFHDLMQEQHAAIQVDNKDWQVPLQKVLSALLEDSDRRLALGRAARQIIDDSQGITNKIITYLQAHPKR